MNKKTDKEALDHLASEFKQIIKGLKKYHIGDCKAGVIKEWQVRGPSDLEALKSQNLITASEEAEALSSLKKGYPEDVKFHIIRWTPQQILKGSQTLRDGRTYTLQEAFSSPTITKLDVIALVLGRYTDFSVIYEFHNNGKALNPDIIDPEASLKKDIKRYKEEGNPYKSLKRKFALAKLHDDKKELRRLHDIINSDLGKLYVVLSDVSVLASLLEQTDVPAEKLNHSLSSFKHRLANIYQLEDYLRHEKGLLADLDKVAKTKGHGNKARALRKIEAEMGKYLKAGTEKSGGGHYYQCL
jgi:hypothetical protein